MAGRGFSLKGKDDILDALVDLVASEIDVPSSGGDWREAMRRRALSAGPRGHSVLAR